MIQFNTIELYDCTVLNIMQEHHGALDSGRSSLRCVTMIVTRRVNRNAHFTQLDGSTSAMPRQITQGNAELRLMIT